ncbi:MAG: NYN domain-containing protein [Sedimentisphaerales bacterium]|nr:NYN domain-containing protein [Sedimentisphaerales bacterium]
MYIIDGYNLLKLIQTTSSEFAQISDIDLCRFVSGFLKMTKRDGVIIFDGKCPGEDSCYNAASSLEVIFAGPGKDADSLIEQKISSDSAPRRLLVVSNDRRIRKAARARKAVSVKSEQFWTDLQKALKKRKRMVEPAEKRRGLDEGQTKQWMEYFGLEQ